MANSISKAQAEAIASGFLDGLGSDPEFSEFVPKESVVALIEVASLIIQEATDNLNAGGHVSSGDLASSLKIRDPRMVGSAIVLEIEALYYYKFLNKGVKGTKSGSGPFKFKSSYPSKKMVAEIREWMKRAGLSTTNVKKPVSKLETKNQSISNFDAAYVVARSIKQKGIKGNGFFDKAMASGQNYAETVLGKALKADVINTLPKTLNINGGSNTGQ